MRSAGHAVSAGQNHWQLVLSKISTQKHVQVESDKIIFRVFIGNIFWSGLWV